MLALRLPEEIETRLQRLADETGRSKTFYAKEAILKYLEDMEDIFLADKALKAFRESGEQLVGIDELEAELGLGD
ncbi:CopG family transcriptional regulator [[Actinobacillus] muris]|uniref:Relaxosome protein TraY n=1 Tax=Muribacter muris TaxID=67855 RepID=A0A0J5PA44_9PAST|nr:DUF6290 family protein [Muribacter muris]KMK52419.1 CopG family transcriptional regulator [[Actinobacillus] muris] [Muribacter muris]MBF0785098.1 TraY domain-containing protein [Muribacter muris]MBF0826888.1 TraY domain-containing protein [Muribacter muris]TFV10190.1 TraY domain-containing protein [Muribacter muris]